MTTFVYTDGTRRRRLVLYGGMANGGDDDDASKMCMGSILRQRCGHFQSNLIKDGSRVVRAVKMVVAIRARAVLLAQSARGTPFLYSFLGKTLCGAKGIHANVLHFGRSAATALHREYAHKS